MKNLNQKGVALITVMIAFLTLFILLGMIVMMTLSNQSTSIKTNDFTKAYYIAESGLNIRTTEIKDEFYALASTNIDPNDLFIKLEQKIDSLSSILTFSETTDIDQATLSVADSEGNELYPNHLFYTITSVGTVNGTSQTVSKEIGFSYTKGGPGLIIGKAILTQRNISIGEQSSVVKGPIASNLLDSSTINFNGKTQDDIPMVFVPTGKTSSIITADKVGNRVTEVSSPYVFPTIVYPTIPTSTPKTVPAYTFTNNEATINVFEYSSLENMNVADGQTLIVNLGTRGTSTSRKMLVVKNMNVSGNIRVIGTGRLLLVFDYSKGTLDLGPKFNVCGNVTGSCLSTNPDYTKFLFYLRTPNIAQSDIAAYRNLNFSNLQLFYGSILGEYVNIEVKSGNFKGHIVTGGKSINFSSNSVIQQVLFYAPFADIIIDSNAVLSGSLVGNNFIIRNPQTLVTYIEVGKETFPFTIDFPVTETSGYNIPGTAKVIEGSIIGQ